MCALIEHWRQKEDLSPEKVYNQMEAGNMAVMFVLPFPPIGNCTPEIDYQEDRNGRIVSGKLASFSLDPPFCGWSKVSVNVLTTDKDGKLYVLESLFKALNVKITSIDSKKLSWDQVRQLHKELDRHLIEDGLEYPEAEAKFASWLTGEWTRIILEANNDKTGAFQKRIRAIRGPSRFSRIDGPTELWIGGVLVKPLRAIFGDTTPANDSDNWWPFPVRYNFCHVPDNKQDAIAINKRWETL